MLMLMILLLAVHNPRRTASKRPADVLPRASMRMDIARD